MLPNRKQTKEAQQSLILQRRKILISLIHFKHVSKYFQKCSHTMGIQNQAYGPIYKFCVCVCMCVHLIDIY